MLIWKSRAVPELVEDLRYRRRLRLVHEGRLTVGIREKLRMALSTP